MGFERRDSGTEQTTFLYTPGGNAQESLTLCIQEALKALRLDITIDTSAQPSVLNEVITLVVKLQVILSRKKKCVSLKGLDPKLPPALLSKLTAAGFNILDPIARTQTSSKVSSSEEPLISGEEYEKRVAPLKTEIASLLEKKRFLVQEKKSYLEYDRVLMQGASGKVDQTLITKIGDLEKKLKAALEVQGSLKIKKQEVSDQELKDETELKKSTLDNQTKFSEKKKVFDKKMGELEKDREKLNAEFKKRQDARTAELAKLSATPPKAK